MKKYGADKIIVNKVYGTELSTFFVGFDLQDDGNKAYRWAPLIKLLVRVIPEFAFGTHTGETTDITELVDKVSDAAKAIYKIDVFQQVRDIYLDDACIEDSVADRYLRKGEFGELILHLLLRDFYSTIPLLAKIYFKDSLGHAVHGFDAVHIEPTTRTLWLGESKLYIDGKSGVKALIQDIKEHFTRDYLDSEFSLISKKVKLFDNIPESDYWIDLLSSTTKLSEQLNSINIPLLCTYTSDNFTKYDDETIKQFIDDYTKEVIELKNYFDENNDHPLKNNLNIILLLFPVKCKNTLVRGLHRNLSKMQTIGEI